MSPSAPKTRFHRLAFAIHRWTGLASAALILFLSVTGVALVLTDEIDTALNPKLLRVTPRVGERVSLDRILEHTRRAFPRAQIHGIRHLPEHPADVCTLQGEHDGERWFVHVDPYDGRVLGGRTADRSFVRVLLSLHYSLLSGRAGEVVSMLGGLVLTVSVLSGLYVYRRRLLATLRRGVRWHRGAREAMRDIHRLLGVIAFWFALLIAVTGIWLHVAAWTRPARPPGEPPPIEHTISIDTAVAHSRTAIPGFVPTGVALPLRRGDAVRVLGRMQAGNPLLRRGSSHVDFDAETGAIRRTYDANQASLGQQIPDMILPLHFGNYGGLGTKLVYVLFGLAPAVLALTGFLIWRSRRSLGSRAGAVL